MVVCVEPCEPSCSVDPLFDACGSNQAPHCLDYDPHSESFVAGYNDKVVVLEYDAATSVGVILPVASSSGHKKGVTCVKWIENGDAHVASSSVDGTVIIWKYYKKQGKIERLVKIIASDADETVCHCSGIATTSRAKNQLLLVTAGADSTLRFFAVDDTNEYRCLHKLDLGRGLAFCSDSVQLPNSEVLVAVGFDDKTVRTYLIANCEKVSELQRLKGHEDWIRDVAWTLWDDRLWLATCSQDSYVRVWASGENKGQGSTDAKPVLSLDTVLSGHDAWVYSVVWSTGEAGSIQLLTSSMDKSIIIWAPPSPSSPSSGPKPNLGESPANQIHSNSLRTANDVDVNKNFDDVGSSIWTEKARLGEIGGSNMVGFYRAVFGPGNEVILANGYQGGWHGWKYDKTKNNWQSVVTPTGHFGPVTDLAWDPGAGQYLVTCSQDQTTRVFAQWKTEDDGGPERFYEVARPQIHGHDMQCLACVDSNVFVSGAEEKVLRAFGAPRSFAETLRNICSLSHEKALPYEYTPAGAAGASVPALGLSNKVVQYNAVTDPDDAYIFYHHTELHEPPTEAHLKQNTLWPELQKLYGHGYEVYALAANPSGTLVASSCKASKLEYAQIIIWSRTDWQQRASLQAHALTVTQLAFSPTDGAFLLSVSRDRTFAVFERRTDEEWTKRFQSEKKGGIHSRIIWCCAWSHDSAFFSTGSRDKKLVIWKLDSNADPCVGMSTVLELDESVTAVDFAPRLHSNGRYLLSCGLETGQIVVSTFDPVQSIGQIVQTCTAHTATVSRLRFRPSQEKRGNEERKKNGDCFELATCSHDWGVKVFKIELC